MACILKICICSFLLAVIAGHVAEGRNLKTLNKQNLESFIDDKEYIHHEKENQVGSSETKQVLPEMSSNVPNSSPEFGSSMTEHVNGFQPTAPGNSPGVGHSHAVSKQIEQLESSTTSNQAHFLEGNTDDFRPTGPGRSPGVGHSEIHHGNSHNGGSGRRLSACRRPFTDDRADNRRP